MIESKTIALDSDESLRQARPDFIKEENIRD